MTVAALGSLAPHDGNLIDGIWRGADDGATLPVTDPATGECIGHVPDCGAAETMQAVDAAARAFPDWSRRTAAERAAVLKRWHALVLDRQEELAALLTTEQGKPLAEARGEIAYGAGFLEWFAEEGRRTYGATIPEHTADRRLLTRKMPVGVVACVTPWNFPLAMIARKVAPALAAGCTAVVKPSELTLLTALAFAALGQEAGLPAGVLNVVTGDAAAIGGVLTSDMRVCKLSFTGSTRVGGLLMRQCSDTVKRLSLELGGNAPLIVFDDADLDVAVRGTMGSKFRNAGQTCVCANRILVQDGIYQAFVERLRVEVAGLKVGRGLEPGTDIGPLINREAVEKVDRLVLDATANGARATMGGASGDSGTAFYPPTVLEGCTAGMAIANEEIFGPVAAVYRFRTETEAIGLANATPFGLASYLFTDDLRRAFRVSEALEVGMVGVNEGIISTEIAPFGGVKQSGLGREGGAEGIGEYLETKYLCLGDMAA